LDFVLPERFGLRYRTDKVAEKVDTTTSTDTETIVYDKEDPKLKGKFLADKIYKVGMRTLKPGFERPVIVHRAILGSVERMFAILCEHTAGKWPFWLSPRQIAILPIKDSNLEFAQAILNRLTYEGFEAEVDETNGTFKNKIRVAESA